MQSKRWGQGGTHEKTAVTTTGSWGEKGGGGHLGQYWGRGKRLTIRERRRGGEADGERKIQQKVDRAREVDRSKKKRGGALLGKGDEKHHMFRKFVSEMRVKFLPGEARWDGKGKRKEKEDGGN